MYGKDTTKSTFDQLFEAVTSFTQNLKEREVDKYIKKFSLLKFILLMSFTQLNQLKSLRAISGALDEENLAELIELTSISAAQISRKLRSDLLGVTQELFAEIIRQAGINQGFQRVRQELGRLYLIDSTVIACVLADTAGLISVRPKAALSCTPGSGCLMETYCPIKR